MRAMVLDGIGARLRMEDREDLVAGPGEAVVRLRRAALNHRDVWIRKGQYAGLRFPIVLGSDGVGRVSSVGDGVDPAWIGRDVVANPSLDWGGEPRAQGPRFRILGLPDDGTFAQEVRVRAANLAAVPAGMDDEQAAALPLSGLTAYRALFSRGGLRAGERVLVTGAGGGTASMALGFAVAAGARVWATTSGEAKAARARGMGAAGTADYREPGWGDQLREAGGFDLIVDSAGGEGFGTLVDLAAPGGRIVFFGATAGDPPTLPMRKVFWKGLSLLGTTMGSPDDFAAMLAFVAEKGFRPEIDRVFHMEEADAALDRMAAGEQAGKILLEIP